MNEQKMKWNEMQNTEDKMERHTQQKKYSQPELTTRNCHSNEVGIQRVIC